MKLTNKLEKKALSTVLVVLMLALVALSLSLCLSFAQLSSKAALAHLTEDSMKSSVETVARHIDETIDKDLIMLQSVAMYPVLQSAELDTASKQAALEQMFTKEGVSDVAIYVPANGSAVVTDPRLDKEVVNQALSGTAGISSVNVVDDKVGITMAVPIWSSAGDGSVTGAFVIVRDESYLNGLIGDIQLSKSSTGYLLDERGTTIADEDLACVLARENSIEESATDKSLVAIANLERRALKGETAYGEAEYGGVQSVVVVTPVGDTGWVLGVYADKDDFFGTANRATIVSVLISFVFYAFAIFIARMMAKMVAGPLQSMELAIKEMSLGNFDTEFSKGHTAEFTSMYDSLCLLQENTKSVVQETSQALDSMANKNFDVKFGKALPGVYAEIQTSIRKIATSLNSVMLDIKCATEQVDEGAGHLATASTSLATGAAEQSASIEHLKLDVEETYNQIITNKTLADSAFEVTQKVNTSLKETDEKMDALIKAMDTISNKSDEISSIVKAIDDIAFQTNILALNAAVEAARAGQAGKGFAVVADEVRNLASKSAESAKEITALINDTTSAIAAGVETAEEANKMVRATGSHMTEVVNSVTSISQSAEANVVTIDNIRSSVEEINDVVQANSATAEESAATSEELSAQATTVFSAVSEFTLLS